MASLKPIIDFSMEWDSDCCMTLSYLNNFSVSYTNGKQVCFSAEGQLMLCEIPFMVK